MTSENNSNESGNDLLYVYTSFVFDPPLVDEDSKIDAELTKIQTATFYNPQILIDCETTNEILDKRNETTTNFSVEEFISPKNYPQPKWFRHLPNSHLKSLGKLLNYFETVKVNAIAPRFITRIVKSWEVGLLEDDVKNVLDKYWPKSKGGIVDFDQFLYYLATYEDEKTESPKMSPAKIDSEKKKFLFSAIVIFSCASTICSLGKDKESTYTSPYLARYFLEKSDQEMVRLSSKIELYRKMISDSRGTNCPYLEPLKFVQLQPVKKKLDFKVGSILSFINAMGKKVESEDVLKKLLSILIENGSVVASLPSVHFVPTFREVLALATPFDAICSSTIKHVQAKKMVKKTVGHLLPLNLYDRKKNQRNMQLKISISSPPLNPPPYPDFRKFMPHISKSIDPRQITPILKKINTEVDYFYKQLKIRSALRNKRMEQLIPVGKFEEFESKKLPSFILAYRTYKPSSPNHIFPYSGKC